MNLPMENEIRKAKYARMHQVQRHPAKGIQDGHPLLEQGQELQDGQQPAWELPDKALRTREQQELVPRREAMPPFREISQEEAGLQPPQEQLEAGLGQQVRLQGAFQAELPQHARLREQHQLVMMVF